MTKKQLLALIFGLFSLGGFAQRSTNLEVTIAQPADQQNIEAMDVYLSVAHVKNLGPDVIGPEDTLWLQIEFSGIPTPTPIYITGQTIPVNGVLPLNQQIAFDQSWIGMSCTFCARVDPLNAPDELTDPDGGNNQHCIALYVVQDVTATPEIAATSAFVSPVPADQLLTIHTQEPIIRLTAVAASGTILPLTVSETYQIDCSTMAEGLYLLYVETASGTTVHRLVVKH